MPEVTIPPEVTPENVTTSIVDTSCKSELEGGLSWKGGFKGWRRMTDSQQIPDHNLISYHNYLERMSYASSTQYAIRAASTGWQSIGFRCFAERGSTSVVNSQISTSLRIKAAPMADGFQVPVILVGNKIDLRGGQVTNQGLEDEIAPIMREFKVGTARYGALHCLISLIGRDRS